ncbi:MAG: FKBP-type peptidyl-prolyl cis-trans isomerase [Saprospiraceae bacterium]
MKKLILYFLTLTVLACNSKTNNTDVNTKVEQKSTDLAEIYQYYHANASNQIEIDENLLIDYIADKNIDAVRTNKGVFVQTLKKGSGEQIKTGDEVSVDYKGYFLNDKEFDSSYKRGKPITFRVGSMVPAWNEVLPLLTKGSKATLFVPSSMGYGNRGFPGYIEPNTCLIFDIEIKK